MNYKDTKKFKSSFAVLALVLISEAPAFAGYRGAPRAIETRSFEGPSARSSSREIFGSARTWSSNSEGKRTLGPDSGMISKETADKVAQLRDGGLANLGSSRAADQAINFLHKTIVMAALKHWQVRAVGYEPAGVLDTSFQRINPEKSLPKEASENRTQYGILSKEPGAVILAKDGDLYMLVKVERDGTPEQARTSGISKENFGLEIEPVERFARTNEQFTEVYELYRIRDTGIFDSVTGGLGNLE